MKERMKRGLYTAAVSAFVIAIVIVINLVLGSLPSGTLEYDISGKDIYTVSEQSVDFLKTLDKDISIVVLAQTGAIDERVSKFISNYASLSPHISLKIVDPVLDPTAKTTYNAEDNNIVVTCTETNKTKILNLGGIDGYQDGLILYDANAYYTSNQLQPVYLDAEGQLTSAVGYVTSETTNKAYLLSGHGESELGITAYSYISKANIDTASLNLLTDGSIPPDCELILCFNPTADLADDERVMLETYLRTGGNVMIILDDPSLANFNKLMAVYGLEMQNGYIGDQERYYKAYADQYGLYCIYPELSTSSDITSSITADALLRFSRGLLEATPERRGAVITAFMTTSEKGLLAVDETSATEGQYIIGATSVETFEGTADTESRLTVITAIDLLSDDISAHANLSNFDIFLNAINKNYSQSQSFSIPAKSLSITTNTIAHPGIWSLVFIGILPIGILVVGLVTWNRRRNR